MIRTRLVVPAFALVVALGAALPAAAQLGGGGRRPPAATPTPSAAPAATPTPESLQAGITRLEAALKANPNDKEAMSQLAGGYLQAGRPDLALQLTQKLLQGGTKSAQIYFIDGSAHASLGRVKEGTASLEQASNLEPTNILILRTLTSLYMQDNRPADAERIAKRALTFNQGSKDAYENYGFVLAAEKKYEEARQQFEAAAKIDPKDPHPIVLIARAYTEENAIALAQQSYDRALAVNPKDVETLVGKAELLAAAHNVKDSVATYNQVLQTQSDDLDKAAIMDEIATVYAREKMDSLADETYRRAIDTYPSITRTHVVYGDYLASKNDKAGAKREWTAALGAKRDNADALQRLGQMAAEDKDLSGALDNFKQLVTVSPNDPRAHFLLGQVLMAQKNYNGARDEFRSSYNLSHTPDAMVALAAADEQTRNFKEAVQIYEALDKGAPDIVKSNPGLLYNLGKAYQAENQPDKAKGAYTRFLAFLKPGSQGYKEVQGLIAGLGPKAADKPAPSKSAAPKK